MKYFSLLLFITIVSCNGQKVYPKAENAFDAGREFIDGYLKGDFKKAGFYMLHDDENNALLKKLAHTYNSKSPSVKKQYKSASITINSVEDVTTGETIINYENSFDKVAHKVKVVNKNGTWLVDLKYTFDGNL